MEGLLNHNLTPADVNRGARDRVYRLDAHTLAVSEPDFLEIPVNERAAISRALGTPVTRLDVLRVARTPADCPYGAGKKVYVLAHNMLCIAADTNFLWMQVEPEVLPKLGLIY